MLKTEFGFQDVSGIEWDSPQSEDILTAMHSGDVVKVHQTVFFYFLEVLPPRRMGGGMFIFCEGDDFPRLFVSVYGEYYCLVAVSDQNPRKNTSNESLAEYTSDMSLSWKEPHLNSMRLAIRAAHAKQSAGV